MSLHALVPHLFLRYCRQRKGMTSRNTTLLIIRLNANHRSPTDDDTHAADEQTLNPRTTQAHQRSLLLFVPLSPRVVARFSVSPRPRGDNNQLSPHFHRLFPRHRVFFLLFPIPPPPHFPSRVGCSGLCSLFLFLLGSPVSCFFPPHLSPLARRNPQTCGTDARNTIIPNRAPPRLPPRLVVNPFSSWLFRDNSLFLLTPPPPP